MSRIPWCPVPVRAGFALSLALLLAAPLSAQPVAFGLFGDTPYTRSERAQLPAMMAQMDAAGLAFVVHDGDIKSGSDECSDATLRDILDLFGSSRTPLVYVPGDNEWTDCHRRSNGGYDPLERLARLRELFFQGETALGGGAMPLLRQSRQPAFAQFRENVRWEAGGALFVGLNLPGSENNYHGVPGQRGPVPEFLERSAANRAWLAEAFAHARRARLAGVLIVVQANPGFVADRAGQGSPGYREFLAQLADETRRFARPVVLVHGDTHRFRIDQPLVDPVEGSTLRNFTRVETMGSPFMGWVRGTVDAADPQVFRFEPRFWPGPAAQGR
ncbi:MAG: hypothetical protein FGM55_03490 [Rhodoferax sp.]|nr:hypothetical protein [Rhodoferax sp.]